MALTRENLQRLRTELRLVDSIIDQLNRCSAVHSRRGESEWVTEFEIAIEALDDLATNLEVAVGDEGEPTP